MNKTYILEAEPGHFTIQGGSATFTVEKISETVDAESRLPPDVKLAVKEYMEDLLKEVIEALGSQIEINIPQELSQYKDIIIEIIKLLFNL